MDGGRVSIVPLAEGRRDRGRGCRGRRGGALDPGGRRLPRAGRRRRIGPGARPRPRHADRRPGVHRPRHVRVPGRHRVADGRHRRRRAGGAPSLREREATHDHFDAIDDCYDTWLPLHFRAHVVARKTGPVITRLGGRLPAPAVSTSAAAAAGTCGERPRCRRPDDRPRHVAPASWPRRASTSGGGRRRSSAPRALTAVRGEALRLRLRHQRSAPRPPGAPAAGARSSGLGGRSPGGVVFVHEMSVVNPLFRFYLGYVFPILKGIEEGFETYLDPRQIENVPGLESTALHYFSFMPDFVPARLLDVLTPMERRLDAACWRDSARTSWRSTPERRPHDRHDPSPSFRDTPAARCTGGVAEVSSAGGKTAWVADLVAAGCCMALVVCVLLARGGIWEYVNTSDDHALCDPLVSVQRARCISVCACTQTGPNRRADIQPCPQPKAQCWRNFKVHSLKD